MYFVFKQSFLLHCVTNQNFKKKRKFFFTNTVKKESKKNLKGCVSEEKLNCNINYLFFKYFTIRKVVNVVGQRVLNKKKDWLSGFQVDREGLEC